jgi:hypothetical protein
MAGAPKERPADGDEPERAGVPEPTGSDAAGDEAGSSGSKAPKPPPAPPEPLLSGSLSGADLWPATTFFTECFEVPPSSKGAVVLVEVDRMGFMPIRVSVEERVRPGEFRFLCEWMCASPGVAEEHLWEPLPSPLRLGITLGRRVDVLRYAVVPRGNGEAA